MKRSEAIEIVKEIILSTNGTITENPAKKGAEEIIGRLEELNVIDSSQFGSVCSRCDRKSWEEE